MSWYAEPSCGVASRSIRRFPRRIRLAVAVMKPMKSTGARSGVPSPPIYRIRQVRGDAPTKDVCQSFNYLFHVLNERRLAKGLQAPVDLPVFALANEQSSQDSADAV